MTTAERNLSFNENAVYDGNNNGSLFLTPGRGLIDSINRVDTTTFDRYKTLKSQDWDENEFPLIEARNDFLNPAYAAETEMMINNIGWQWAGDSSAASSMIPMLAPFNPVSDAWLWIVKQGENECLHGLSYAEIVRIAVPDGQKLINRVHTDFETMRRVRYITEVFDSVIRTGAKITLGMIDLNSDEASDALMLALCSIFMFERGQFMPSFANTAALYYANQFVPVGQTVRKIAIDEFGTHIPQIRYFIENELKLPQRQASMKRIAPVLKELGHELTHNEVQWNKRQFSIGGDRLLGVTEQMSEDFIYYGMTDISNTISVDFNIKSVTRNPLPYMDKWLDLNTEQKASMEAKGSNYLVGQLIHETSAADRSFDLSGL